MPQLQSSQFEITDYTEDRFEGNINVTEGNNLIFTSLAYDQGWKVYIDGERVETIKLIEGTVGFYAPEGQHTLEMKYRPDCLILGVAIQIVGLAAFALIWVLDSVKRKKLVAAGHQVYEIPAIIDITPDETAFEEAAEVTEETEATPEEKGE
jgi:uncharacterized membrane protein YfhO